MKNKPLTLSIVIPVYNEERYLEDCLGSIARQTESPDEVIVIDNNSSDRTAKIAKHYSFVRLLSEHRQGVVFARNRGFDSARSVLIGRVDGDTILSQNWVKDVKKFYKTEGSPKFFALTSPSYFRNHLGSFWYAMHRITYFWPARLLLGHTTLVGSNMVISRKLWCEVKDSVCLRGNMHEDMDLSHHVARTGTQIRFCSKFKASIVARKMATRVFYYPIMMLRARFNRSHLNYLRPL